VVIDVYENAFDHPGIESVSDLTQNMPTTAALGWPRLPRPARAEHVRLADAGQEAPHTWTHTADYVGNGAASRKEPHPMSAPKPAPSLETRQLERFLACLDPVRERGIRVVL
jgi:hypothetical protein